MTDESANLGEPAAGAAKAPGLPAAVDRATFQAELDRLRVREKAHTREGDAIAAARRRLPMVEVDANLALIGPHGPLAPNPRPYGWKRCEGRSNSAAYRKKSSAAESSHATHDRSAVVCARSPAMASGIAFSVARACDPGTM